MDYPSEVGSTVNQERPNEQRAKEIVERVMSVQLCHADTHGGVDYVSPDGTVAVEVTAVTEGRRNGVRDALKRSVKKGVKDVELRSCWIVMVDDLQDEMKTFIQRAQPAIAALESAGETTFVDQPAHVHILQNSELSHAYRTLLEAGVTRASSAPHQARPDDPGHSHQIVVSLSSGGSVTDSNDALGRLLESLKEKPDNAKKLSESGAAERHLFVWVNRNTAGSITRTLDGDAPDYVTGWGAPSIDPTLDKAITHLWVAHEGTGRGWLWNGESWRELSDL